MSVFSEAGNFLATFVILSLPFSSFFQWMRFHSKIDKFAQKFDHKHFDL